MSLGRGEERERELPLLAPGGTLGRRRRGRCAVGSSGGGGRGCDGGLAKLAGMAGMLTR
jgi:hypothetical protein